MVVFVRTRGVGVVARVVFLCGDGVTVRRVVRVHELAVLGADLVMNERVVQGGKHLHEQELCQNEGTKDTQPRRKSRLSCGAER